MKINNSNTLITDWLKKYGDISIENKVKKYLIKVSNQNKNIK
jgi:hypothetical protein